MRAIGFILRNERSSEALSAFVVSVDGVVEQEAGLDFSYVLENEIEEELEPAVEFVLWNLYYENSVGHSATICGCDIR